MLFIQLTSRGRIIQSIFTESDLLQALNEKVFTYSKIKCVRVSEEFLSIAVSLSGSVISAKKFAKLFRSKENNVHETYRLRGYTREEAAREISSRQPSNFDISRFAKIHGVDDLEAKRLIDERSRRSSKRCVEFWTHRGYSLDDAIKEVSKVQKKSSDKCIEERKTNPEKYKSVIPNQIGYWLKKGFSQEDASKKQAERQATFNKDICIQKYGYEDGMKRWQARQDKWLATLAALPEEEKDRISDQKIRNSRGSISKSEKHFIAVLNENSISVETQFKIRYSNDRGIATKIYDAKIGDVLIEFHGDYYHANPITMPNLTHVKGTPVELIRKNDEFKRRLAEDSGYTLIVVWASDFAKSPNDVVAHIKSII